MGACFAGPWCTNGGGHGGHHLQCEVCQERRQPKTRRQATLPAPRDVGEQVQIDLVVIEEGLRQGHYVVHMVDAVSRFKAGGDEARDPEAAASRRPQGLLLGAQLDYEHGVHRGQL